LPLTRSHILNRVRTLIEVGSVSFVMLKWFLNKIVGTKNQREVRRLRPLVARINEWEQQYQQLSDEQLRAKTDEFKQRIEQARQQRGYYKLIESEKAFRAEGGGDEAKTAHKKAIEIERQTLDEILPEAFAAVKNACRRLCGRTLEVRGHPIVWDMVPFDVQLIGGIALHSGKISEMATGEGKTLVATSPLYLNALTGKNVHLVTVNDYLAARDSEWMGAVYKFLGLTVGCIQHDQRPNTRREQYACDITYGTNSEFGFDYLRDNGMADTPETQVQRGYNFAIVDEVDSILIDEARTPLIISGPSPHSSSEEFAEIKPGISELVRKQTLLCTRLVNEAKAMIENADATDEDRERAGQMLYQVRQGMPKNKQLLRLMEEPESRKLIEKSELSLLSDMRKVERHALKEELFFVVDEKGNNTDLTEKGRNFLSPNDPDAFVIPDLVTAFHEIDHDPKLSDAEKVQRKTELQTQFEKRSSRNHNISQLLRAYCIYEKDVEYVVQEGKVVIVDEFTGRLMPGRRWSDGLHAAVEAKEGVTIERETQTLATITIQNYFRLYDKLAGMTGTAETEAGEFKQIYNLDVLVIPTNRPVARKDHNDVVYKTRREKYNAIVQEITETHAKGQPLLVGTVSVESSETLSRMLRRAGITHNVLNAKYHQREAEIVTLAGQRGAVTIATNMAGRGTDIKLGSGVKEIGGLHVLGTERHEARRIDRQLRGRCARQGDPGSSRFYVSLEDDLMRLFATGRIASVMTKMGLEEGQELQHPLLNRSIEQAQKRVEQNNFGIRKRTLEYDDVMNKQREIVYGLRNEVLHAERAKGRILDIVEEVVFDRVTEHMAEGTEIEQWDVEGFVKWVNTKFPIALKSEQLEVGKKSQEEMAAFVLERVKTAYAAKESVEDPQAIKMLERYVVLNAIDRLWQEHLSNMDALRAGIHLRQIGQKDPLIEYKKEAFDMFEELLGNIKEEIVSNVFRTATSLMAFENLLKSLPQKLIHEQFSSFGGGAAPQPTASAGGPGGSDIVSQAAAALPYRRETKKVGRNEPCPCGSGKKYKNCCGVNAT